MWWENIPGTDRFWDLEALEIHSPALETEGKGEEKNHWRLMSVSVPVAEQVGYMCSVEIKSALGQGVSDPVSPLAGVQV